MLLIILNMIQSKWVISPQASKVEAMLTIIHPTDTTYILW